MTTRRHHSLYPIFVLSPKFGCARFMWFQLLLKLATSLLLSAKTPNMAPSSPYFFPGAVRNWIKVSTTSNVIRRKGILTFDMHGMVAAFEVQMLDKKLKNLLFYDNLEKLQLLCDLLQKFLLLLLQFFANYDLFDGSILFL